MRATLLPAPPVSGTIPEVAFAHLGPPVTWVEFEDASGARWAGVFDNDDRAFPEQVVFFDGQPVAFVVARGRAYVVDVATRTLRYAVEPFPITGALAVTECDLVLATGFTSVLAFAGTGDGAALWERDIALDGIFLHEATAERATGWAWMGGGPTEDSANDWHPFTLRLADRTLELGEPVPQAQVRGVGY